MRTHMGYIPNLALIAWVLGLVLVGLIGLAWFRWPMRK